MKGGPSVLPFFFKATNAPKLKLIRRKQKFNFFDKEIKRPPDEGNYQRIPIVFILFFFF